MGPTIGKEGGEVEPEYPVRLRGLGLRPLACPRCGAECWETEVLPELVELVADVVRGVVDLEAHHCRGPKPRSIRRVI